LLTLQVNEVYGVSDGVGTYV